MPNFGTRLVAEQTLPLITPVHRRRTRIYITRFHSFVTRDRTPPSVTMSAFRRPFATMASRFRTPSKVVCIGRNYA